MRILFVLFASLAIYFIAVDSFVPKMYITVPKNTLKRLRAVSQTSMLTKLSTLGVAAGSLGVITGVGVVGFAVYGMIENEREREELNKKLDAISQKLDEISTQLYNMEGFIASTQEGAVIELKKEKFIKVLSKMSADENRLLNMIASYSTNETALLPKIESFIEEYEKQDYESQLVDFLFVEFTGSKSFAMEMLKLCRKYQTNYLTPSGVRASTQKILHDQSFFILSKIVHSFEVLELAMRLKFKLRGIENSNDVNYLELQRNSVLQSFDQSQKRLFDSLNDKEDIDELLSFTNILNNPVRFINVFQNYLVQEEKASLRNACNGKCSDYSNQVYSDEFCKGSLRDCTHTQGILDYGKSGVGATVTAAYWVANLVSRSDLKYEQEIDSAELIYSGRRGRIYERYNYADKGWYGPDDYSGKEGKMTAINRDYEDCDICKCTCDQSKHNSTVRKIYNGKMSAPEGFVVTGVRFAEQLKSLFLQIQVGKLLPMGFVDAATLEWVDIPSNATESDFAYIKFDDPVSRRINLGCKGCQFSGNQVVTAVMLNYQSSTGTTLNVYGKPLESFEEGILDDVEQMAPTKADFDKLSIGSQTEIRKNNGNYLTSNNLWVELKKSDDETDAGQSFIPYFDPVSATFDPPAPLSMIEMIHYSNDFKHAGFIRPLVKSLDYKKFIGK